MPSERHPSSGLSATLAPYEPALEGGSPETRDYMTSMFPRGHGVIEHVNASGSVMLLLHD